MKKLLLTIEKQNFQTIRRIIILLLMFGTFGTTAYSQISTTTPASRCGAGSLVLHATTSSGTIKWYTVPFYGTAITSGSSEGTVSSDGTSFVTKSLSVTKTYYVDAVDANGCSVNVENKRVPVIATISANSIQASIFYASSTFCKSLTGKQQVTRTGTIGGTFTANPAGLKLDAITGEITPSTSTNGQYTVTYTVVAPEGCVENPASTQITITNEPEEASISYAGSPYCTSHGPVAVTQTGATGGTYSATPSGLTLNTNDGTITPATSLGGTYTVTYYVRGSGGCSPQTKTATITITTLPTAVISYTGAPFCGNNAIAQTPTLTGTGAYTGGTFSASGLTINPSTGAITPADNAAGNYTVNYTAPASGNCSSVTVGVPVTINPLPTASISGDATVCQNAPSPKITFTGLTGTPPFTFTYKVNNGGDKYITTTTGNSVDVSQGTLSAESYIYTLAAITDANGCSQSASGTAIINVTGAPVAEFSYPNAIYCSGGTASPTFINGATAGTFSSTSGLVFVSGQPGVIDITNSLSGNYTITNSISGCGSVTATTEVTISHINPTISGGEVASCESTTLSASSEASTATYVWLKNDVIIDNQTSPVLEVTESGNYSVKVTNVDTGCEETSATKVVTINPVPVCSITAFSSDPVKYGSTTTYSAPDGMSSYVWTITGNGTITGATNEKTVTVDATAAGSFLLSLTIKNNNNCSSTCETGVYVEGIALTAASSVASKTYDGTATAGAVTVGAVSGFIGTETLTITSSANDYADANVGTGKSTTISYTLADGTGLASNYSMASISATGNITPLQLTIANPTITTTKVYDGSTTAAFTAGTLQNVVSGDNITVSATASYDNANVGSGKIITVEYTIGGTNPGNYTAPGNYTTTGQINPTVPTAGVHVSSENQIVWKWNAVTEATGYKWSITNDYNSATDLGNVLTATQPGLNCNSAYTIYVWAYNGTCVSSAAMFTATTPSCSFSVTSIDFANTSGETENYLNTNDQIIIVFSKAVNPSSINSGLRAGETITLSSPNDISFSGFYSNETFAINGNQIGNWNIGSFNEIGTAINHATTGDPSVDSISLSGDGTILTMTLYNGGSGLYSVSASDYLEYTPNSNIKALDGSSIYVTSSKEPIGSSQF